MSVTGLFGEQASKAFCYEIAPIPTNFVFEEVERFVFYVKKLDIYFCPLCPVRPSRVPGVQQRRL